MAAGAGAIAIVGGFLKPRQSADELGADVSAGHAGKYPRGGEPTRPAPKFEFWLSNLDPSDNAPNGTGGGAGLLACWQKCPHLGSPVTWRPDFEFEGLSGWFYCARHGSTFTKAGVRVYGPAPRSLDTMRVTVDQHGTVTVHTGDITLGAPDNPSRAVRHPLLPA